ncbi:MAG: class I SAM-dependent methyltransferase [Bacteroidales bacterium]|nr:class I SAM-dependent methyltransferase [Bacteroidales bacterium]
MNNFNYQYNFSEQHKELYDIPERQQKANKIISVLKEYFKGDLKNKKLIDVGCSTGIMTKLLSEHFSETAGVDIDINAIAYAKENFKNENLNFYVKDAMNLDFPDSSADVVNCSHIYEHVPDSKKLMSEIYRILKPEGVCFFAAGNRFVLIEAHYKLPLLSVIPKWMAHKYIKLFNKADFYYENHLTYWRLKKLVSAFEINDFTKEIIKYPDKYYANDMIKDKSASQYFYLAIMNLAYWICPTYIWVLKKKSL